MIFLRFFSRSLPAGVCPECRGTGEMGRTSMGMVFNCIPCRGSGKAAPEKEATQ